MYITVGAYDLGFGTIIWIVINEFFPVSVRSAGCSIVTFAMTLTGTILIILVPTLKDMYGYTVIFSYFVCICTIALVFMYMLHPDTRGLNIDQAYKVLNKNYIRLATYCGYVVKVDSIDMVSFDTSEDIMNGESSDDEKTLM